MNHNIVVCDECQKEIRMNLLTKYLPGGVQRIGFKCEHCHKDYFCYATNEKSRKLQRKIKKELNYFKKNKLIDEHTKIVKQLKEEYRDS